MASIKLVIFDQKWKVTYTLSQEGLAKDALASKYNYQVNVHNPAYNPALPVTAENSPLIPNPLSKEDYIAKNILEDLVSAGKIVRLHEVVQVKQSQATAQVNTEFDAITVEEDLAP